MENLTFGETLKKLRESHGYSYRVFGSMVELTGAYIRDIEIGNKNPPENHLTKIADVLKLSGETRDNFFDLAAETFKRVPDLSEYVYTNNVAKVALRKARDKGISDEIWQDFINLIEEK